MANLGAREIGSFFSRTGLKDPQKPEIFWKQLNKKYGDVAIKMGECISAREIGQRVDPYPLKNSSLNFANAIASQFDRTKLEAVAKWLVNHFEGQQEKRLLEIGCDNGIMACFLASMLPDWTIVAIDPCAEATECAKERASQLGLNNLDIYKAGIEEFSAQYIGTFDYIISIAVWHEILVDGLVGGHSLFAGQEACFSIEDLDKQIHEDGASNVSLAAVNRLMRPLGQFISVDRWGTPAETLAWIRKCANSELNVSLHLSDLIEYKDFDKEKQILPLTVFLRSELPSPTATEVLSLKGYKDFLKLTQVQDVTDAVLAELLFTSMYRDNYLWKVTAVYRDGSGTMETILSHSAGVGFVYSRATTGFRRLRVFPVVAIREHYSAYESLIVDQQRAAEVSVELSDDLSVLYRLGCVTE